MNPHKAETPYSQVTPVSKVMERVRKTALLGTPAGTPESPVFKTGYDIDTPTSPFAAGMSANSKKAVMRYINDLPDYRPLPVVTPKSTVCIIHGL